MGCNSCNKDTNGLPRGCNNNGNCASGTCGTFTVFDWLESNISILLDKLINDKSSLKSLHFKHLISWCGLNKQP